MSHKARITSLRNSWEYKFSVITVLYVYAIDRFEFDILLIVKSRFEINFLSDWSRFSNDISSKTAHSMHNLKTISKTVFISLLCRITFRIVGIDFGLSISEKRRFVELEGNWLGRDFLVLSPPRLLIESEIWEQFLEHCLHLYCVEELLEWLCSSLIYFYFLKDSNDLDFSIALLESDEIYW